MVKKQYTPDMVARNLKYLGNGTLEVTRYNFGHIKANGAWPWFLCIAIMTLYDIILQKGMFNNIQWAISVDWALEELWADLLNVYKQSGKIISPDEYEIFKAGMIEMHRHRLYWGLFFLLCPIFLFLWLASPKWRPLRIDSKRHLIYFWSWGKFYIKQYPEHIKDNPDALLWFLDTEMFNSWMHREAMGCLIFNIPHENPTSKKKIAVPVGLYRPVCEYQNYALRDFILDYLCSEDGDKEYARYFKKEKRIWRDYFNWFYQFSLFPAIGYNEKKTEARIQAWLAKYGDGK